MSSAGCLAAACHGHPVATSLAAGVSGNSWTHAGTHRQAVDPHDRAYDALTGPLAGRIVDRLRASEPRGWAVRAADEPRCLACHTNPRLAGPSADETVLTLRAEGVSCEACHGNAGRWLHAHTTWTAGERSTSYARHGMTRLYDLGERAMLCAGCHVGAPADPARRIPVRDMNHDMIAAGHPRLSFELGEFQRRLIPHWQEKDRARDGCPPRGPEAEATAWLIGRVATAEAASRLLADRAGRDAAVWPEFAEYNCASCHHELAPEGQGATRGRTPGTPAWQTVWPLTHPDHADAYSDLPEFRAAAKRTEGVRSLVESPAVPRAKEVRKEAEAAADALEKVRLRLVSLPDRQVARAACAGFQRVSGDGLTTDDARQMYLGLAALERAKLGLTGSRPSDSVKAFGIAFEQLARRRVGDETGMESPVRELLATVPPRLDAALK